MACRSTFPQRYGSESSDFAATPLSQSSFFSQQSLQDEERLEETDWTISIKLAEVCGSGSNYAHLPTLTGYENWAEWDEALKNAALAERVAKVLDSSFQRPMRPADDCSTKEWNHWVHQAAYWDRLNDNLLSGIRMHCSQFLLQRIPSTTPARDAYRILSDHCNKRRAHVVADLVDELLHDNLDNYASVREYSRVFKERLDEINRLALNWQITEELSQLWYLSNLGETFKHFRSTIYKNHQGNGSGQPITLGHLMERAEDEFTRTQIEDKFRKRPLTTITPNNAPDQKVSSENTWVTSSSNYNHASSPRNQRQPRDNTDNAPTTSRIDLSASPGYQIIGSAPTATESKCLDWIFINTVPHHICCQRFMFTEYRQFSTPKTLNGGGITGAAILATGTVPIVVNTGSTTTKITLQNVLHVPSMHTNLVSIGAITERPGVKYVQTKEFANVLDGKEVHFRGITLCGFKHLDYSYAESAALWSKPGFIGNPTKYLTSSTSPSL
ncbi:hypothetical protein SEPCBS119000_004653 [Sporothrix epigloea]|uniref:Retrovirus-related Pol polyprotein from transposon TNT 1-94-like beta-barrel domain-containing protein n=1 Tax=Sporothrix epigloea TaxID=1892477 RepID=A0ABP0DUJ2_9PEZI